LALLVTIFPSTLLLVTRCSLLGLVTAFLLGALVEGRGEIFQCSDQMDAEVALRFMGFLNRLGNPFDSTGEVFERAVDALEAGGDALEEFCLGICFGSAHSVS
jgi:hypothetical protein